MTFTSFCYIPTPLFSCHTLHRYSIKRSAKTKTCSFAHGLLYSNSLGKQIVIKDKSLRSFAVFMSAAVKHCVTSDGINQLCSNKY